MSVLSAVTGVLSGLAAPVAGVLNKRTERKAAREAAQAKAVMQKQAGQTEITLTDAEWESLSVQGQDQTWKDEYVTVLVTAPIALVIVGAVAMGFGEPRILEGAKLGAQVLVEDLGLDYATLAIAVVLAAVGLKVWRQS